MAKQFQVTHGAAMRCIRVQPTTSEPALLRLLSLELGVAVDRIAGLQDDDDFLVPLDYGSIRDQCDYKVRLAGQSPDDDAAPRTPTAARRRTPPPARTTAPADRNAPSTPTAPRERTPPPARTRALADRSHAMPRIPSPMPRTPSPVAVRERTPRPARHVERAPPPARLRLASNNGWQGATCHSWVLGDKQENVG